MAATEVIDDEVTAPPSRALATAIVGVLVAVVVVLLWIRSRASTNPTAIALAGLAPFTVGFAAAALAIAGWTRRVGSMLVAAATFVASLAVIAPHDAVLGCGSTATDGDIVVLTANVRDGGADADDIADLIVGENADVVVLQETTEPVLAALEADPRLAELRHHSNDEPWAPVSVITWSRWPISLVEMEPFSGVRLVHTRIDAPSGTFVVSNVHTTSPSRPHLSDQWARQFEQLSAIPTNVPRVMAGDFNATEDHRVFRDLLDRGWSDAHDDRGCGLDATWPADGLFAVFRLDHVLVTDHFSVEDLDVLDLAGSDHKAVVAAIRPRTGS